MSIEAEMEIQYSLAKRVPAMASGFTIATSYGCIQIDAEDAAQIMKAVEQVLNKKLKELQ